jgi:long-chain acyl-CoA synthetase
MNVLLYVGGALSLLPRFDGMAAMDGALEAMARDSITYFAGVPTMVRYLLQAAAEAPLTAPLVPHSLSLSICGGAPMPEGLAASFEQTFKLPLLEGYGMAETSPVITISPRHQAKAGSIGLPIWGTEVHLRSEDGTLITTADAGEIVVRGHNVMKGYYKRPEATAEVFRNGWFHTGDIARRDADGYFYMVDRKRDVINRGGVNVYPREVEAVLHGHPAVAEAAVMGVADPSLGEEVSAILVLKPQMHASANEIIDYCRERMAAYKYPRYVEFRDSLPKDATGKVLKRP